MSQRYRIVRDDGGRDRIAGSRYASYDDAYAVLERYYGDLCCSDGREYYRIEELPEELPEALPEERTSSPSRGDGLGTS